VKRLISIAGAIGFTFALISCGGGGGGSSDGTGGVGGAGSQPLSASTYTGYFVGTCIPFGSGTNYETGSPLYIKSVLKVGQASGPTAGLEYRLDFFDNASCAGEAVGVLQNTNTNNVLTLVSGTTVNGLPAHKLRVNFSSSNVSYLPGPTSDTVIYGSDLRLKLPRFLMTGFAANDFWSLNNNDLYEGSSIYGADGFPQSLSTTPTDTKVSAPPPLPEAPCAAQTLNWVVNGNYCVGLTTPAASRLSQQLQSSTGTSTVGGAIYTCNNGTWSAPANAACNVNGPVIPSCPVQTITWTANSNTCSGVTPVTYAGNDVTVSNTVTGYSGGQRMSCQADGSWTIWNAAVPGNCSVPPPPITDPLQLAQAKNCLACHTVTGAGYSTSFGLAFPSFQQIANFYRPSPPAAGVLEHLVKSGSVGIFGTTPMSANPQVSDADLAILIPWILATPP
jgi:cytochrome c